MTRTPCHQCNRTEKTFASCNDCNRPLCAACYTDHPEILCHALQSMERSSRTMRLLTFVQDRRRRAAEMLNPDRPS